MADAYGRPRLCLREVPCTNECFGRGRSSARLERRPVTSEVVGSNPIGPASYRARLISGRSQGTEKLKLTEQTKSVSHENALTARRWLLIDAAERPLGRV